VTKSTKVLVFASSNFLTGEVERDWACIVNILVAVLAPHNGKVQLY
jgi:hypothetical protein